MPTKYCCLETCKEDAAYMIGIKFLSYDADIPVCEKHSDRIIGVIGWDDVRIRFMEYSISAGYTFVDLDKEAYMEHKLERGE